MGTSRELVRLFAELLNKELVDLGTSGLLSHLPQDLGHLACNLGGTRKDDRAVTGLKDTGMFLDSNQGGETLDWLEFTILFVVDDVTRVDLFVLGNTLDGQSNGVTWSSLVENLLVLFDGENLLPLEV